MKEKKMATQGQGNSKIKKHKMKDRLSALPDELLHHILSFLDMKIAVQTSVLSRRWRYLWHTLPFLHFNSESFESFSFFEDFVCNVLSHRQSYREVLVLSLECDCYLIDWSIVDDILDYVVPLGIQYLRIGSECVVDLTKLSSGDSSTALKLNYMKTRTWNADILKTTEPVKFELFSLKKLSLANCAFGGFGEDNFDPFRGCVNLQTLAIENCVIIGDSKWFEISAPRLMDFSLYWMDQDRGTKPDSVIVLSTPKLTSFSYVNSKLYEFSINVDLPCMEQVIVGVYILRELKYIPEGTLETTVQGLATLFKKMGKAKIFSTSSETIDVLFKAPLQLENFSCPFPALSTLKIEVPNKVHSFIVPKSVKAYLIGENHDLKAVEECPGLLTFSVLPTSHFTGDLELSSMQRKDVDEDVAEECP